jgi:hypothetical protein
LPTLAQKLLQQLNSTDLKELTMEELEYAPLLRVMAVIVSAKDRHPLEIV